MKIPSVVQLDITLVATLSCAPGSVPVEEGGATKGDTSRVSAMEIADLALGDVDSSIDENSLWPQLFA